MRKAAYDPAPLAFTGPAALELERRADREHVAQAKRLAERRAYFSKPSTAVEDIPNHELRAYVEIRAVDAEGLLAELSRVRDLEAEWLAEIADENSYRAEQSTDPQAALRREMDSGKPENMRSPVGWKWARKGLFGDPRADFRMFEPGRSDGRGTCV